MGDIRSLSEYLRRLNTLLVCPKVDRTHFLAEAQRMADDYRQGNLASSDEEVIEFLGPPEELAQIYLASLSPDMLTHYQRNRRRACQFAIGIGIVLLLVLSGLVYYLDSSAVEIAATETLVIYPEVDL